MIDPKELRIGNTIQTNTGFVFDVNSIKHEWEAMEHIVYDESVGYSVDLLSPIPITPEWLEQLGFEITDGEIIGETRKRSYTTYSIRDFEIDMFEDCDEYPTIKYWYAYTYEGKLSNVDVEIHYIHQLQNLYFALTGQELTVKELTPAP
ncbi:MAG TPA: hypothetical protein VGK46_13590 [Saprospiraceae bacterium]